MSFDLILPFFPREVQNVIMQREVSDVMINGSRVFVDRNGRLSQLEGIVLDPMQVLAGVENIGRFLHRDITPDSPILDARLPDGSRVAAIASPSSPGGMTVTIRKFNRWFTADDLVASGTLPEPVLATVTDAISQRKNLLIAGGTGSGKTTLLKALIDLIPLSDRLIVIENPAELDISHANAPRWEITDKADGHALLIHALRHRPDRIIFGEVRDHSAYQLLQAMNTGHGGTMSTIHADSAALALYRLAGLALSAQSNLDASFIRSEVASAIHYVLFITRRTDGTRRVTELLKVAGYSVSEERFLTNSLFAETA
ncbi:MAG TPA: ATPase, T2SS/T4P/T4SS family [Terriglobales bacterium]|nr:ATPase, T2SS/T4P/T4SS family [Terriglobales bacterium]